MNQRSRTEPAIELDPAAFDRSDALVPGFVGPDLRRGVAEHERSDEFGPLTVELLGDHAADRHADDRGPADAEDVEKGGKVAGVVGHLAAVRPGFGKAMAALVVADDAEVGP